MITPRRCRFVAPLAAASAVLLLPSTWYGAMRPERIVQATQPAAPRPPLEAGPLAAGVPVERELASGDGHAYQITLAGGAYANIVVVQLGVDVVIRLRAPDGAQIGEMDGPGAMHGQERLAVIAPASGVYRLEVRRFNDASPLGRYRVSLDERNPPTEADRTTAAAVGLLMEGQRLWGTQTAQSAVGAVPKLEEALALWSKLGDRHGQAETLWYLADVHRLANDRRRELAYKNREIVLRRELGDARAEAVALSNLSRAQRALGEYQNALETSTRALRLARTIENYEELGSLLQGIGSIQLSLGEYHRAIAHFEEALQADRAHGFRDSEADVLWSIGAARHSAGEFREALPYFEQSLAIARTLKIARRFRQEATALAALGRVHRALGDTPRAMQHFEEAIAVSRKIGWRGAEATSLTDLGQSFASLGDTEKAIAAFDQALAIQRAIHDREFEASTRAAMARAERGRGNLAAARGHAASALDIVESLRANVAQEGARAAYQGSKEAAYKLYIDLLMTPAGERLSEADAIAGLGASERWRARSLLEILSGSGADLRQGLDTDLVQRDRRLQDRIAGAAARQAQLFGAGRPEQIEAAGRELELLLAEYRQMQVEIRTRSPRYAALTEPQPLAAADIQREVLDGESLLLEYSLGPERSHLWAVTRESVTGHVLPRQDEIEPLARRAYELLTARSQRPAAETTAQRTARLAQAEAEYWTHAARLSDMLLGPVAGVIGGKRLAIVADGALLYVPFGALPAPGTKAGAAEYRPLILDHEIVGLPSASVLHVLRRELLGRAPAARAVAVLADPVFSGDDPRLRSSARTAKPPRADAAGDSAAIERSARASGIVEFERLRFSRNEADAVMALAGADRNLKATDFTASKATATSAALADYRIVHFATHGLLNNQHPELSGLVLSLVDQAGRPQDGFLRLHDIYNLRLSADLVVLSACRTALGREIRGEGLLGLARGFMYAGAPRIVASLWNVDDRATAELMKQFYTAMLEEGRPPAAALRKAQVEMWNARRWRSPYYWAAFVIQGEWR